MQTGKHLDIGCGSKPRNPFRYSSLSGVDIYRHPDLLSEVDFRLANLAVEPIPFDDSQFDSISAFDFIEHVPRVLGNSVLGTRFPFIDLMNEIWRVLKPDGVFLRGHSCLSAVRGFPGSNSRQYHHRKNP